MQKPALTEYLFHALPAKLAAPACYAEAQCAEARAQMPEGGCGIATPEREERRRESCKKFLP